MFSIGWSEIAVVLIVALLVIQPKDMPEVARTIGRLLHKAKNISNDLAGQIRGVMEEGEIANLKKEFDAAKNQFHTIIDLEGKPQKAYDLTAIEKDLGVSYRKKPKNSGGKKA